METTKELLRRVVGMGLLFLLICCIVACLASVGICWYTYARGVEATLGGW